MIERMKGKRSAMTVASAKVSCVQQRGGLAGRTKVFLELVDPGGEGQDNDIYEEEENCQDIRWIFSWVEEILTVGGHLGPAYR
jgi:hypothetical protein